MKKEWTWETIADTLIADFKRGTYKKGEKMPSENKLAGQYGVTRAEIRKAYERLKELGYVYSMQGYGSFYSGKRKKIRLVMNHESFSQKMAALHLPLETRNLGCQKVRSDSLLYEMLQIDETVPVYKITRLRLLDKEPIAIHTSFLPGNLFPDLDSEGKYIFSVYDYIHNHGFSTLETRNNQLMVSSLNKKERACLNIQGYAPSLILTSCSVTQPEGIVVEIARTIYRSDHFIFEF